MAKNVYHVVTDLHDSDKGKENRINYQAEIEHVKNKLIDICADYKSKGFINYVLLLGDVYDRGYTNPDESTLSNNFWIALSKASGGIYSVIGNHELSFYKSNPFYTLMSEMLSTKIQECSNRMCSPRGLLQIINVVDELEDGNVIFHFNHYDTPLASPKDGKVNIALYHKDLVCREILDEMKTSYNVDTFESFKPIDFNSANTFRGMDYNFFGHMHTVYGCWNLVDDKTNQTSVLYYLASLGRPNVTEVNDLFLERDIPSITVEDGIFTGVHSNKFLLMDRKSCIKEEIVQQNVDKYQKSKKLRNEKNYVPVGDDPIRNLQERCSQSEALSQMLGSLITSEIDECGISLRREVGNFLNG